MSDIVCPECQEEHSISEMELWSVYESDGCETEIDCQGCGKDLVITSEITGWSFDVIINE